jgi:hypothetical protein
MTLKRFLQAISILGGVALLFSPFATATPEFAKKEEKQCVYCHTAVGKPDLNEAGKYYKERKTLEGFESRR